MNIQCYKCHITKPRTDFPIGRKQCNLCIKEIKHKYYINKKNAPYNKCTICLKPNNIEKPCSSCLAKRREYRNRPENKVTCECGGKYRKENKQRHFKSNKHQRYINKDLQ